MIRLKRIYNILLFHATILSLLNTFYTNLHINLVPVPVAVFCMILTFQKINIYGGQKTLRI
jgi:hypothetical protein